LKPSGRNLSALAGLCYLESEVIGGEMPMARLWMRAVLVAGLAALAAEPVASQMSIPGWGNFGRMRQHMSDRAVRRATTPTPGAPRAPMPSPTRAGDIGFTPQAAELAPALMAGAGGNYSRAERQRMQRQLSEYLAAYRDKLRASGGPQNDVARAAAYLASASHEIYFGTSPISDAQFQALRGQFERQFAASGDFQQKSDRERQIEFEIYAILGTMIIMMQLNLEDAPDPAGTAQMKRLAGESFVGLMGVPPEQVRMTSAGYEIVGG
jgi:hypothetical protein